MAGGAIRSSIRSVHSEYARFVEQTNNPATPPSGYLRLFAKDDNFLYMINDQGQVIGLVDEDEIFVADSTGKFVDDSSDVHVVVDLN